MAERMRRLWGVVWSLLSRLARWVARLVVLLGHSARKQGRLWSVSREARTAERRRDEVLENLGKMVYLLYKRNLVRNADLLAECEKIVALDAELDTLTSRAEEVRSVAPPAPRGKPVAQVAAVPLEAERMGAAAPLLEESSSALGDS